MLIDITPSRVNGLSLDERADLEKLLNIYRAHEAANAVKNRYYEGRVTLGEVNLGIALPHGMRGLEIGCAWGAKNVDVLAARSMFDGFVDANGGPVDELREIVRNNRLIPGYSKATKDELNLGCAFATLGRDEKIGCKIRFYSAMSAAARWDGDKDRIASGFTVVETGEGQDGYSYAWRLYYYTDTAVIVLTRMARDSWVATRYPHRMGRPLMEPLIWNATSAKPFGRSRNKHPIRELIKDYVRTMANATIGLEFSTAPQKYLLGVTDDQYDALINDKFRQYVGNYLAATTNPETGEKPTFGQLPQGTISPHVEKLRMISTQFSAATGLSVTDTGVVNDANPTSSDAIEAQTKTLTGLAEDLNEGNAPAMVNIGLMALAISRDVTVDELPPEDRDIMAHFKNPAMPSIAASADAAVKIASVRPSFAQTDAFLEMNGFDQAEIRRIKNQEQRARGLALAGELE